MCKIAPFPHIPYLSNTSKQPSSPYEFSWRGHPWENFPPEAKTAASMMLLRCPGIFVPNPMWVKINTLEVIRWSLSPPGCKEISNPWESKPFPQSGTVDGSEIFHQLRLVVESIPLFTKGFSTIPGGAGFLKHQQYDEILNITQGYTT